MNIIATAVSLSVGDVTASSRFFTTHLGFRELVTADGFACLGRDDSACDVVLVRRDSEPPPEAPLGRGPEDMLVSFTVTGIAAEQERLRGEGAAITMPLRREPWGEWVLRLTDPNGVVVQLVEWLPPAGP
ncbi:VOC family protein [Nonomuraea sp. NPDC002799]